MFKKRCQFVDGGEWYCLAWALCWCREGIALLVGGGRVVVSEVQVVGRLGVINYAAV